MYDILVQLTGLAMQRLLKSTALEHAPGSDVSIDIKDSDIEAIKESDEIKTLPASEIRKLMQPLKTNLDAQKRDERFRARFRLPPTEHLVLSVHAIHPVEEEEEDKANSTKMSEYTGKLSLSETYLTFNTIHDGKKQATFFEVVMPLYTIRRVEKLTDIADAFQIKIVNWHQSPSVFILNV